MTLRADNIDEKKPTVFFYVVIVSNSIFIPLGWMIQGKIIRDMLRLLNENKQLIETIQAILQMFPEGVLIQSQDKDSNESKLKFANIVAKIQILMNFDCDENLENFEDTDSIFKLENNEPNQELESLTQILNHQNDKLQLDNEENKEKVTCSSMVKMVRPNDWLMEKSNDLAVDEDISYYNLKSIKVSWGNNKNSFMHIFVDMTSIKKLEKEKAKISWQNIMLASVSHEFRTPMNAFDNSLQLIKMKVEEMMTCLANNIQEISIMKKIESIEASIQKFMKMGSVSSQLLMHLVEDILDLGKFEAGTFSLNNEEFLLKALVEDIEYIFSTQWKMKGIDFNINIWEELVYSTYKCDQGRVKQVLLNLISNSLKFTQRGGSITVEIIQFTQLMDKYLKFSVTDTGTGIPAKDINKLFQMFSMLDKHKNEMNQKGTGIGLAISKKIVEKLGGEIVAQSEEGKYSQFSFTIFCHPTKSSKKLHHFENIWVNNNEQKIKSQRDLSIPRNHGMTWLSKPLLKNWKIFPRKASIKKHGHIFDDCRGNLAVEDIDEEKNLLFVMSLLKAKIPRTLRAIVVRIE